MPQIEQIQVVHWGPLRPDPVDLATDGINVATGPNGSGKTTFLDAVKLILGVDDLGRRPAEYIFDGGGDPGLRAGRALVKATFANPERIGSAGRLFSDVGRGCELASHVTAICEVTRDGRRYIILPGHVAWGRERSLEQDLARLNDIPAKEWMRPKRYGEVMARAGVSRALLGVISLKQGETDRAIEGTPEMLLRRVLELTGKQSTLEEFRAAKAKLIDAKREHADAEHAFRAEQTELARLELQAQRYEEYVAKRERLARIESVDLPAASHASLKAERDRLASERDGYASRVAKDTSERATLEREIPDLQARLKEARAAAERLQGEARAARAELAEAAGDARETANRLRDARAAIEQGRRLADPLDEAAAAGADGAAASAERERDDSHREQDRMRHELAELRAGRPPRPLGLDPFRELLSGAGITSQLIADHVEAPAGVAAEAALGDGVWTLVVPAERLEDALRLAFEHGYRLPIAAEGDGKPDGALAGASGLPAADAYLEEVTLPLGVPGVDDRGMVRGRIWGAYRAPVTPVLGAAARERAIRLLEERLAELDREIPRLDAEARQARDRAALVRRAVEALQTLDALEAATGTASERFRRAEAESERIDRDLGDVGPMAGKLEEELRQKAARLESLERDLAQFEPRLQTYIRDVERFDEQLAATPLTQEQEAAVSAVESVDRLESERDILAAELSDEVRFPEEVRSKVILAYLEGQQRSVGDVRGYLEGRQEDLDNVTAEVDRAKQRYDSHLREVIDQLGRRFREVCEQAGMEGLIERIPSEVEGEFGIDVKVAHAPGEPKRSYRSQAHSGGQRAKISILLLLGAMGLEGSADLLIMDEHVAHLDSRNIEFVAQLMSALKDRVQFILATPTNAEALRQGWCDHQIAFYAREPGEPYAPPVKLLTRMPEGRRYAAMGQVSLAD